MRFSFLRLLSVFALLLISCEKGWSTWTYKQVVDLRPLFPLRVEPISEAVKSTYGYYSALPPVAGTDGHAYTVLSGIARRDGSTGVSYPEPGVVVEWNKEGQYEIVRTLDDNTGIIPIDMITGYDGYVYLQTVGTTKGWGPARVLQIRPAGVVSTIAALPIRSSAYQLQFQADDGTIILSADDGKTLVLIHNGEVREIALAPLHLAPDETFSDPVITRVGSLLQGDSGVIYAPVTVQNSDALGGNLPPWDWVIGTRWVTITLDGTVAEVPTSGNTLPHPLKLVRGPAGNFFGISSQPDQDYLVQVTPAGQVSMVPGFNSLMPEARYVELQTGPDGKLLGNAPWGGSSGIGGIFTLDAEGEFELLHSYEMPYSYTVGDQEIRITNGAGRGPIVVLDADTIAAGPSAYGFYELVLFHKADEATTNLPPSATDDLVNPTEPAPEGPSPARAALSSVVESDWIAPLANDSDPNGDALTISSVSQPVFGTVELSADGKHIRYRSTGTTASARKDAFRYVISDGRGGVSSALVVVDSNPGGEFQGELSGDERSIKRFLSVSVNPRGGLSGRIFDGTQWRTFTGRMTSSNAAAVRMNLGKGKWIDLSMELVMRSGRMLLDAMARDSATGQAVTGTCRRIQSEGTVTTAGRYTLFMPRDGTPTGKDVAAHGTLEVRPNGQSQLLLNLADGRKVSLSGKVTEDGRLQLFALQGAGKKAKVVTGTLRFRTRDSQSDCEVLLDGLGLTDVASGAMVFGTRYTPPARQQLVMPPPVAAQKIAIDVLTSAGAQPISFPVTLSPSRFEGSDTSKNKFTAQIDRTTGTWSGTVQINGIRSSASGVFIPVQRRAVGFYRKGSVTGSLEIDIPQN